MIEEAMGAYGKNLLYGCPQGASVRSNCNVIDDKFKGQN